MSIIGRVRGGGRFALASPKPLGGAFGGAFAVIALPGGGDTELDAPALDVEDLRVAALAAA